jgi:glycosyltransferase involved in cell wall biosynthesis
MPSREQRETIALKIALCAPTDIHALARSLGQQTAGVTPGLGSTATTPLITEFLRRGHDVTVYTLSMNLPGEEQYHWGRLRLFVGSFRKRHLARNFYRPEIAYLEKVIKADAPSFVHAHWTYEFSLGALKSGVPTVTTIHDLPWNVLRYYRDPHRFVRLLMAYEVALRGRHFTAVSEYAASHFRRFFKPGSTIKVIPNGLPDAIFDMSGQPAKRDSDPVTFATILQGWSRRKNATVVLEAFRIVRGKVPGARLLMFGVDYEEGGPADQWAMQKNLYEDVTFVGVLPYHDLLKRVYEEVDVIVHPSLDEALSMTALEGLALKKVFIAGESTPGMEEILGFSEAGVLLNMRDPAVIAGAMVRLGRDKAYRNSVATRGYDRASTTYRMDTVATKYEALYKSIWSV